MPLQTININQQPAQINVRGNNPARMQISTPRGQIRIQNNRTELNISTQMPTFRVPKERLRNELNLAGPLTFARQFSSKGKRAALRAAATYASEGDYIANKNIPGDKSIPRMVANKMRRYFQKPNTNIGLMPSSPPSLDWTKGHIEVNASRHNIAVDWNGKNMADISVDANYPVEVSLSRRHNVSVSMAGPAVTKNTYGRYIDRQV